MAFVFKFYNEQTDISSRCFHAVFFHTSIAVDEIVDQVANIMTEENQEKSLLKLWNEQFYE